MRSLVLTRRVEIEKFDVLMEIARQQKREELVAILMLAREHGGKVTAVDICQQLLLGRPESVGKVVIDRCHYLDLVDEKGALTEIGNEALQTRNVFIPERGRFLILYTDDPLLPQRLLHLQPTEEPPLYDEIKKDRNGQRAQEVQKDKAETLPEKLHSLEGGEFNLLGQGGGLVTIRKIESHGISKSSDSDDDLRVILRINTSGPPHLSVDGKFKRTLQPPNVEFEEAFLEALGSLRDYWDDARKPPALRSSFEDLKDDERASFQKTIHLVEPKLDKWGAFENTSVDEVPVIPLTSEDATQWAEWLLIKSIDTYLTQDQYQIRANQCESKFPDFPNLRCPSSRELTLRLWNAKDHEGRLPRQYWYLQASLDLQEHQSSGSIRQSRPREESGGNRF